MTDWKWISLTAVLRAHDEAVVRFGGLGGIRDLGTLESALARPVNLAAYGSPDIADLAAAYAVGIARAHAFVDGKKRTAWMTARAFLRRNGSAIAVDRTEAVVTMLRVASGDISADQMSRWFRERRKD